MIKIATDAEEGNAQGVGLPTREQINQQLQLVLASPGFPAVSDVNNFWNMFARNHSRVSGAL
jgi:hypothetical protein